MVPALRVTPEAHHRPNHFLLFILEEERITLVTEHNVADFLLLRRGIEVLL